MVWTLRQDKHFDPAENWTPIPWTPSP